MVNLRWMKFRGLCCLLLLAAGLVFAGCVDKGGALQEDGGADSLAFRYATLLKVYHAGEADVVVIRNPWKPGAELHRYVLVARELGDVDADELPRGTLVRTPLSKAAIFSSVHLSLLQDLDALGSVLGVCDLEYVQNSAVHAGVAEGVIRDMGSGMNPNVELIVAGGTDGLLVSPFENAGYGALEQTGIPLIECADYMEVSPLARAEWMRLYGRLFGRAAEADSMFLRVEEEYLRLKQMAATVAVRPTVMCDMLQGAAWYVPGGRSTMGQVYQDAGADYLFQDRAEAGSLALGQEEVLSCAVDADVWFLKYGQSQDYTYAGLRKENPLYAEFAPYKRHRIYGCNTLRVPFYDVEPFHPDLLLADIISILHPQLLPDHDAVFFTPLAD